MTASGTVTAGRVLRTVPRVVGGYVRAGPFTTAYLLLLVAVRLVLDHGDRTDAVLAWLSTNLDNLARHPLGSLAGSLLVINGPLRPAADSGFGGTLITVGLGIGVALWWLEARAGTPVAAAVLIVGHVAATLLTAVVIGWAIATGRYPPETRSALDVGVSYGAEAALAAVTVLLPRWARAPWVLFVLAWPLADAEWFGALPDFTTVGHLLSAAIGGVGAVIVVRRARARVTDPRGAGDVRGRAAGTR